MTHSNFYFIHFDSQNARYCARVTLTNNLRTWRGVDLFLRLQCDVKWLHILLIHQWVALTFFITF